jgi:hypothetical protein
MEKKSSKHIIWICGLKKQYITGQAMHYIIILLYLSGICFFPRLEKIKSFSYIKIKSNV